MKKKENETFHWIVSEVALYFFLYYVQFLLNVEGNLWMSSLILTVLINLTIIFCPFLRKCQKTGK